MAPAKITSYINWRMRITILDGRQLVGRFLAFGARPAASRGLILRTMA